MKIFTVPFTLAFHTLFHTSLLRDVAVPEDAWTRPFRDRFQAIYALFTVNIPIHDAIWGKKGFKLFFFFVCFKLIFMMLQLVFL